MSSGAKSKTGKDAKTDDISLKVMEAYTRDVGRGIARIDYATMDAIKTSTGDIIEIKGKKRTVAKCLPLYPSDEGKGIIRIDGLGRTNSGIAIGDKVSIQKVKALAAEKIVVAPLEAIPPIDERYLASALESVPLIKGDNVVVPYFGGRLTFQIIGVTPAADAVVVTQNTVFHIAEKVSVEKPKIRVDIFFSDLQEMYREEFDSLQKCLDDKKIFNELVGELLIRTNGLIAPPTASKFVECMGELSTQ